MTTEDDAARNFYAYCDFLSSPSDPLHLFMLLKDARKIVSCASSSPDTHNRKNESRREKPPEGRRLPDEAAQRFKVIETERGAVVPLGGGEPPHSCNTGTQIHASRSIRSIPSSIFLS